MEVKINKEIRSYSESVMLGLNLRQFVCIVSALVVALVLTLTLKERIGRELLSYIIILSSAPFAFLGFFRYHGMSAEKAACAFIRDRLLEKTFVPFIGRNTYCDMIFGEKK